MFDNYKDGFRLSRVFGFVLDFFEDELGIEEQIWDLKDLLGVIFCSPPLPFRHSQRAQGRFLSTARTANIKLFKILNVADLGFMKKFLKDKPAETDELGSNHIRSRILKIWETILDDLAHSQTVGDSFHRGWSRICILFYHHLQVADALPVEHLYL